MLALLGVGIPQTVDRQATIFVADASASIADAQGEIATFISQSVAAKRVDDAYAVVTTGRTAEVAQGLTRVGTPLPNESSVAPEATDLSAGLRLAMANTVRRPSLSAHARCSAG